MGWKEPALVILEYDMSANSGKTAIVTGASSGIGWASAEALAQAGFTVSGRAAARPATARKG